MFSSDLQVFLMPKPADCMRSISLRCGTNHKCFFAYSQVKRSLGSFFNNLIIRSLTRDENLVKLALSKQTYLLVILFIVSLWYSVSNGVAPAISSQRVIPTAHESTFYVQLPPRNISGALQQQVPVLVNISQYLPLNFIFLLTPKSINFTIPFSILQSILSGLISLWQMFFQCRQVRASNILQNTKRRLFYSMPLFKEEQGEYSMIRLHNLVCRLRQIALQRIIFSCLICFMLIKLVLMDLQCQSYICNSFTANTFPVYLCMHFFTTPCAPSPNFSYSRNISSKAFYQQLYCSLDLKIQKPSDQCNESTRLGMDWVVFGVVYSNCPCSFIEEYPIDW